MATAVKTVRFAFQSDVSSLASNTRRDLTAITVYLPESSIVFKKVVVKARACEDATATGSVTATLVGIKLGAVAFDDNTITDTYADSTEAKPFFLSRDVTSYFTTNWTGTSMTCQVALLFNGMATQNHCAVLEITYEFDDTSATQIKTVLWPIESTRTVLTTTYQTVGGATALPQLTGGGNVLPESGVTIRQKAIELWGGLGALSTVDFTAQLRVNGGTDFTWYDYEAAQNTSWMAYGIYDATAEDLSAARSLECRTVSQTNRIVECGGWLMVTYEFTLAGTTRTLNMRWEGFERTRGVIGNTTSSNQELKKRKFYIEEPGTITLHVGAIMGWFSNRTGGPTLSVYAGAQTAQTYGTASATLSVGVLSLVHRLDAGGKAGAAFATLARGQNTLELKVFASTADAYDFMGFALLIYESDIASGGINRHAHVVANHLIQTAAKSADQASSSTPGLAIPETKYWISSVIVDSVKQGAQLSAFITQHTLKARIGAGEGPEGAADGYYDLFAFTPVLNSGSHINLLDNYCDASAFFRKMATDPDTDLLDIETARVWRVVDQLSGWWSMGLYVTYHSINFDLTGNIAGSAGGTVTIVAFRKGAKKPIGSTSRVGDGAFTIPWFDDTEDLYVVAYEDATHRAVSAEGQGGDTFNMNLAAPAGSRSRVVNR